MPQISKIRIVNLYYNDGNRLVPDELYDLRSNQGECLNTLFHLANGGGKSVLTQFLMQPVLPGAKASGRKITQFFTRPAEHCFILLEWKKDGSDENLLTGISMRVSNAAEDGRGKYLNYYTFLTEYSGRSKYDIASLDLSRNENGRFVPAEFNYVRDLRKSSRGLLQVYSQDDRQKWADKLKEFGIYQEEWKSVIERLNVSESGLKKNFESIATSRKLISSVFIPAIDEKLEKGNSGNSSDNDASLKTMLINYAKKREENQKQIVEEKVNESLLNDLDNVETDCQALVSLNNDFSAAKGQGFAFKASLAEEKARNTEEKEKLEKLIEEDEQAIRHIRYESSSEEYYEAKETADLAHADYEQARKEAEETAAAYKKASHSLDLMKCADLLSRINTEESRRKAASFQIHALETNSDKKTHLNELRFTIAHQADEEIASLSSLEQNLEKEIHDTEEERDARISAVHEKEKIKTKLDNQQKIEEGNLAYYKQDTDKICAASGCKELRMLDGFYPEQEVRTFRKELEKAISQADRHQHDLEKEKADCEEAIETLTAKKPVKENAADRLKEEERQIDAAVSDYQGRAEKIQQIADQANMPFADAFTGRLMGYLQEEKGKSSASREQTLREKDQLEKKYRNIQEGHLHIIDDAIRLASSSGVKYRTAETYLIGIGKGGNLTEDKRDMLLNTYPYLPYALLFDTERDMKQFAQYVQAGEDSWLPSAVPMLTMEQMAEALNSSLPQAAILGCCDAKFFRNPEAYQQQLAEQITEAEQQIMHLSIAIQEKGNQIRLLEKFSDSYDKGWLPEQEKRKEFLTEQEIKLKQEIRGIEEKKEREQKRKEELEREISNAVKQSLILKQKIERTDDLLDRMNEERKQDNEILQIRKEAESAAISLAEEQSRLESTEKTLTQYSSKYTEVSNQLSHIREIRRSVGDAQEETELLPGSVDNLFEEFKELQSSLNADIKDLQRQLEACVKEEEKLRKRLTRMECDETEYQNIRYSDESADRLEEEKKRRERDKGEAQKIQESKGREDAYAAARLKTARDNLEEFGGSPLPMNEIGGDFAARTARLGEERNKKAEKMKELSDSIMKLTSLLGRVCDRMAAYPVPEKIPVLAIDIHKENMSGWWQELSVRIGKLEKELKESCKKTIKAVSDLKKAYATTAEADVIKGLDKLLVILSRQEDADIYNTAMTALTTMKHDLALLNDALRSELASLNTDRENLVRQCLIQGREVYRNMKSIAASSRVKIFDDASRQLIRFDMPKEEDGLEISAERAIRDEIDKAADELCQMIRNPETKETDIDKKVSETVGSDKLLLLYTGKPDIKVSVYKIDDRKETSKYKTWEETNGQKQNSGAQNIVVYFAVVLALMNYTRSQNGIRSKDTRDVLILDNMFGEITSKHLLEPTFRVAKHFHVQLICFSDINLSNVTVCFDQMIEVLIKHNEGSRMTIVTHEGNEQIEHGYYKTYGQMSLSDYMQEKMQP